MDKLIHQFPSHILAALNTPIQWPTTQFSEKTTSVLLLGMGGSAFGAEVVSNLVKGYCSVPFEICRDYSIPAYVSPQTLVIVSSYSGNTEETLSTFEAVLQKGAKPIVISSGGELMKKASEKGLFTIELPPGLPPRAAAGYSITYLLRIFSEKGLGPDIRAELNTTASSLPAQIDHEFIKKLAATIKGKMCFIYSSPYFESAAIRWRQQIEENAKQIVSHHVVPEMNHNELVGWNFPKDVLKNAVVVFLESKLDHPRNQIRMALNREIIAKTGATVHSISAPAGTHVSELFFFLHFGDWLSFYLAAENGVDPMPVEVINFLKSELAST